MKGYLLLILLICSTLQAQTNFTQSSGNQLDYFKSNLNELEDENGNNIFNSNDFDSLILNGDSISNNFGYSVSSAGDVNGDGYSDIVVGCNINSYPNESWRAYIFYGGIVMNNIADIVLKGELRSVLNAVNTAGDVNGDGFSDVIVNVINLLNGNTYIFIYYGGQTMDTIKDVSIEFSFHRGKIVVSSAGDINNDGYSDVMVGFGTYTHEFWTEANYTRIFLGGINMDNIVDVTMYGRSNCWGCPSVISISTAGDVNGDGFSDVIIDSYVYYGGSLMDNIPDIQLNVEYPYYDLGYYVSSAGDINNDGFSDVIVSSPASDAANIYYGGSTMDNIADVILIGEESGNYFGNSVSTAGDINGDGFSDVIVGAYRYNSGTGRVYIYYGGSSMNNIADITLTGEVINNYFGNSVSTAGDINGDGYSDVIVGAYGYNNNTGRVYVYMSKPSLRIKLKVLMEGMYSSLYNQLARKDSVTLLLRDVTSPFSIRDSAKFVIDSLTFSKQFAFFNAPPGNYYLVTKHFNCIETWSKTGGENLIYDTVIYNYDYTTARSQAYGNNLKLKGSKYCIYSGDVNQDGFISLSDVIPIYNDASSFITGRFIKTDLTGDNIVDLTDVTLCYNNSSGFVRVIRP